MTDVELVMLRGGAAGRRWFHRVPLGQRNAGRAVRGQASGGCALPAVMRFALDREPTVIRAGELPGTMTEAGHVFGRGGFVHREGLGSGVGLQYELDAR